MPVYEYKTKNEPEGIGCDYCRAGFEKIQKSTDEPLSVCPKCGGAVKKVISRFGVSFSLDFKAKDTGLHKLVRKDKGVYEKKY